MWEFRAVALSELEIGAGEYWRSTLAELGERLHGVRERQERDTRRAAWVIMHMLNVSGKSLKRDVSIDDLLGTTHLRRRELDARVRREREEERRRLEGGA